MPYLTTGIHCDVTPGVKFSILRSFDITIEFLVPKLLQMPSFNFFTIFSKRYRIVPYLNPDIPYNVTHGDKFPNLGNFDITLELLVPNDSK